MGEFAGEFTGTSVVIHRLNSTGHPTDEELDHLRRKKQFQVRRFSVVASTEEHFRSTEDLGFYGAYGHIRKKLDYSYHAHYTKSRQWLHDSIIDAYLQDIGSNGGEPDPLPCSPWLVLTAGVQGAGKRYSIDELIKTNQFPLLSFVWVDTGKVVHVVGVHDAIDIGLFPHLVASAVEKMRSAVSCQSTKRTSKIHQSW